MTLAWHEFALEEYRALRAEILATLETQDGGLRFGVAAIGLVSAAGFNVWDDVVAAALIFLVVIPVISVLVLTVWLGEVVRMMRAGDHLASLEQIFQRKIGGLPKGVMGWETKLRDRNASTLAWQRLYHWNYLAIVAMFGGIAFMSVVAGMYRALWGDDSTVNPLAVLAGAVVVTLLLIAALYWVLRQLATVCDKERISALLADRRAQAVTEVPEEERAAATETA